SRGPLGDPAGPDGTSADQSLLRKEHGDDAVPPRTPGRPRPVRAPPVVVVGDGDGARGARRVIVRHARGRSHGVSGARAGRVVDVGERFVSMALADGQRWVVTAETEGASPGIYGVRTR